MIRSLFRHALGAALLFAAALLPAQTPSIRYVVVNYPAHVVNVVGSNFGTAPTATFGGASTITTVTNPTTMILSVKVSATQIANYPLVVTNTNSGLSTTFYVDYGPAAMNWKGAWSASQTYVPNDVVTLGGNVYLARNQSLNHSPDAFTADWNVLSQAVPQTITSISLGEAKTGAVKGLGMHYIIATRGIFPPRDGNPTYSDAIIGEVRLFAGDFAPGGWAFCEGQLVPISENTALFSILGTMYGGNGTTTFALPDLRAAVPMGPAAQ